MTAKTPDPFIEQIKQIASEGADWWEGEHRYDLTWDGKINSNYPWLILEFRANGPIPLREIDCIEVKRIKACED